MVCLPSLHGFAQRGTNWCFGDSAGLNFSVPTSPTFFTNSVVSRGTAVSISDINSALLMYAFTNEVTSSIKIPELKSKIARIIADKLGVNMGFDL